MSEGQQYENVQIPNHPIQPLWCECSNDGDSDCGDGDDSDGDDDGEKSYEELEEEYGRRYVEDLYREDPDNDELGEYLNETDTSLSNEDLGLDEDGNRDDNP